MSGPYTYTDRENDRLEIEKCTRQTDAVNVWAGSGVCIPAADLPKVVAEMYRAAGQEPPIILPRRQPEADWVRNGRVRPLLPLPREDMEPVDARYMASWYASAADLADAERETEGEDVARLADIMRDAGPWLQSWLPRSAAETAARAILRAGYAKTGGDS